MFSFSYYLENPSQGFEVLKDKSGYRCLVAGQTSSLILTFPEDKPLKREFKLAVNSGNYVNRLEYKLGGESFGQQVVCFFWGTWWPDSKSGTSSPEIYFDIIGNTLDIYDRYMYKLNFKIKEEEVNFGIDVDHFKVKSIERLTTKINHYLPTAEFLQKSISSGKFKLATSKKLELEIKNFKFNLQGDGELHMMMHAPEDDEKALTKFHQSKDLSHISAITSKILRKENTFYFFSQIPRGFVSNGVGTFRRNILV